MAYLAIIPVQAQRSYGYGFGAIGAASVQGFNSSTVQLGLGGEKLFGFGLGAGGELGALGMTTRWPSTVLGVLNLNASYHFSRPDATFDPFVTGGYSLFFRTGTSNGGNFGGGVNYWFADRVGFRFEVRDQVAGRNPSVHFWGVRFGVTFR